MIYFPRCVTPTAVKWNCAMYDFSVCGLGPGAVPQSNIPQQSIIINPSRPISEPLPHFVEIINSAGYSTPGPRWAPCGKRKQTVSKLRKANPVSSRVSCAARVSVKYTEPTLGKASPLCRPFLPITHTSHRLARSFERKIDLEFGLFIPWAHQVYWCVTRIASCDLGTYIYCGHVQRRRIGSYVAAKTRADRLLK